MIKKNTKLIFEGTGKIVEDKGGIPLSEGEEITIESETWKVVEKIVDCKYEGEDLVSDITYRLRKK
jgi:hypothetical protein